MYLDVFGCVWQCLVVFGCLDTVSELVCSKSS